MVKVRILGGQLNFREGTLDKMGTYEVETWPKEYQELYTIFNDVQVGWWQKNVDLDNPWIQEQYNSARSDLFDWIRRQINATSRT